jgi:hypothetical protein
MVIWNPDVRLNATILNLDDGLLNYSTSKYRAVMIRLFVNDTQNREAITSYGPELAS